MTTGDRYDASGLPEAQFEPGSNGQVLKNVIAGEKKQEYFAAVRAGLEKNYASMERLFAEIIERSLSAS